MSAEERCIELQAKLQAISLQMSRFLGGDPAARDALLETSRELAAAGIIGAAFSFDDITVVAASTTAAAAAPTAAVATTATDVAAPAAQRLAVPATPAAAFPVAPATAPADVADQGAQSCGHGSSDRSRRSHRRRSNRRRGPAAAAAATRRR